MRVRVIAVGAVLAGLLVCVAVVAAATTARLPSKDPFYVWKARSRPRRQDRSCAGAK